MTNVGEGGIKFFLPGRRGILWGGDGVLGEGGGRELTLREGVRWKRGGRGWGKREDT